MKNKEKFYATYDGQCYVAGYGRKLYKRGISLVNVTDCNGNIVIKRIGKALTKALEKCLDMTSGTKIEFDAVLVRGSDISYISNVKEIVQ